MLILGGCSGTSEPVEETSADDTSVEDFGTIRASHLPLSAVAPLYFAESEGIFTAHGLDVEPVVAAGAAARIPALVAGDADFAILGAPEVLQAIAGGLQLSIVGLVSVNSHDTTITGGGNQLFVMEDSDANDAGDLSGKIVAVNVLAGGAEAYVRGIIDAQGGDSSTATLIELPYSSMFESLRTGQIDAASMGEPYSAQAAADGARFLSATATVLDPGGAQQVIAVTDEFLAANPAVVRTFVQALADSTDTLAASSDTVKRDTIKSFSTTDPATVDASSLPTYSSDFSAEVLRVQFDLMVRYGLLQEDTIDLDRVVVVQR